jgi:CRISPR-associated protein Csd1
MQRFADRPASTWLNIEKALVPYQQRLRTKRPALEKAFKELLDDICSTFEGRSEFSSETRLSGEYLLAFHCQRKWLRDHKLSQGQWVVKAADEAASTIQEGNEA